MKEITIYFSGDISPDEIYEALTQNESGFEVDLRQPLQDMGTTIAIIGIVLNVAQLAAALWQIKQNKSNAKIGVGTDGEQVKTLEGETEADIKADLENLSSE